MNFFSKRHLLLLAGDAFICTLSVYAGVYIRLHYELGRLYDFGPIFPKAITYTVIIIMMNFFIDLYVTEKRNSKKELFVKIVLSGLLASFLLGAVYYFLPYIQIGRKTLMMALIIAISTQFLWHFTYSLILNLPVIRERVLILGTGPTAFTLGNILSLNNNGYSLAGYVNCVGESMHVPGNDVLGNGEGLLATALKQRAQKIVVSVSERRGSLPVREVLDCKLNGIDIVEGPSFYETVTGKVFIEDMKPSHFIFSEGFRFTVFRRYIKRGIDVLLSVVGIFLSLPLLLIIPLLIKCDSPGSVLFKQKRVGIGEKEFVLFKFRTMVDGAEAKSGPVWSQDGDARITKLGKWMRKSRIDEIPQLFNVLNGDMSFIGPRPERPFFVKSLKKQIPYYSERHCVKPGLTGWAQVRYEYGDSVGDALEKLKYDLYYIKYQSIALDMLIVLDTIKVVFFGRGGR